MTREDAQKKYQKLFDSTDAKAKAFDMITFIVALSVAM